MAYFSINRVVSRRPPDPRPGAARSAVGHERLRAADRLQLEPPRRRRRVLRSGPTSSTSASTARRRRASAATCAAGQPRRRRRAAGVARVGDRRRAEAPGGEHRRRHASSSSTRPARAPSAGGQAEPAATASDAEERELVGAGAERHRGQREVLRDCGRHAPQQPASARALGPLCVARAALSVRTRCVRSRRLARRSPRQPVSPQGATMPVNTQAIGKTYEPVTYAVGREKIREYARAVGETNPLLPRRSRPPAPPATPTSSRRRCSPSSTARPPSGRRSSTPRSS